MAKDDVYFNDSYQILLDKCAKLIPVLDKLYKDNKDRDDSFIAIFNRYMGLYGSNIAMSLLNYEEKSLTSIASARIILEAKALLMHYRKGKMNLTNIESFKSQYNLFEKDRYFISYNNEKEKYLKLVNDPIKVDKILSTRLPCLLDEEFNFFKLIQENLNPQDVILYKLASLCVHPNENDTLPRNSNFTDDCYKNVINFLYQEYIEKNNKPNDYNKEETICDIPDNFIRLAKFKYECFDDIINTLSEHIYDIGYLCYTLEIYRSDVFNLYVNLFNNKEEVIKSEFRVILESSSVFNYLVRHSINLKDGEEMLMLHSITQFFNNFDRSVSWGQYYQDYKKIYPFGVEEEKFIEEFRNLAGAAINEKGLKDEENREINVEYLIKTFIKDFANNNKNEMNKLMTINNKCKILSHFNGNLTRIDKELDLDAKELVNLFDEFIIFNLEGYVNCLDYNKDKRIIECINNNIRYLKEIKKEQEELFKGKVRSM